MRYTSTVHPVSWFKDSYLSGNLEIRPPFQRKPVWNTKFKSKLIETILLDLPIPEIYLQKTTTPGGETRFAVVDGQQRIRTILQFIGIDNDPKEEEFNNFVLGFKKPGSAWDNNSFGDLTDDEKRRFFDYDMGVRELNTTDDREVRLLFARLNENQMALNRQEVRNAIYSGAFMDLIVKLADDEYWLEVRMFTAKAIRRMKDIEFISELIIGILDGPQGGSTAVLDKYFEQFDDFDDEFPRQNEAEHIYNLALPFIKLVLPDLKNARWRNRADFYSLFVAISALMKEGEPKKSKTTEMKRTIHQLGEDIKLRFGDPRAKVDSDVNKYVKAIEKRVNDKNNRLERHKVLVNRLSGFFKING